MIRPVFDQNSDRPQRWALQLVTSGNYIERFWSEENRYIHWTVKTPAVQRNIYTTKLDGMLTNFVTMRRNQIGFLTTHHRNFYEDGKYTEVFNDPVNYILEEATLYSKAYEIAEKRIGNYRMGVRRHITHLGGTLSDDELDMLEDSDGEALTTFPLFPPKPEAAFVKPFRSHLITSDVGYIDYIKAAHNTETTTARYAHQAKQSTGFRHFIFNAGNVNMKYESTVLTSVSKVRIGDLESVVDAGINTATDSDATTFLPVDGEYVIYNIAANTVIRSDPISGISLEKWDGTTTLGAIEAYINITADGYINILDSNGNGITMDNTGVVITDGALSITMNGTTVDVS